MISKPVPGETSRDFQLRNIDKLMAEGNTRLQAMNICNDVYNSRFQHKTAMLPTREELPNEVLTPVERP
jgi:hypothetical protein